MKQHSFDNLAIVFINGLLIGMLIVILVSPNQSSRLPTVGEVYYDSSTNQFAQVRKVNKESVFVSETNYYEDAETTIFSAPVTREYFNYNMHYVNDVTRYAQYNGVGWRVRE